MTPDERPAAGGDQPAEAGAVRRPRRAGVSGRGPARRAVRLPRWAVVLLVAGGLVVAWAVLGSMVPGPDRSGDRVAVVGDSITALGEPELVGQLGSDHDLTVDGDFGARIADRLPAIEDLAAEGPDQVVVNLGTNDAAAGTPVDRVELAIEEALSALDDVECVHVVTVAERLSDRGTSVARQAALVNEILAEAAGRHPNAHVVDWGAAQGAAAIRRDDPMALLSDGVHPDAEGQRVLAEAYARAIDGCGRPWYLP